MTLVIEPVKIKGHENYILWPDGQVFSLRSNKFITAFLGKYSSTNKNRKNKISYMKIALNREQFYIHRLLAQAYIPNPENKKQVNHIDGNKLNNNLNNLEWVTPRENQNHAFNTGLKKGTMQWATKECKYCSRPYAIHDCRKNKSNFCSMSCCAKHKNSHRVYPNNKVKVVCSYCDKESLRWPGKIKGNTFCNKACQMNYRNRRFEETD